MKTNQFEKAQKLYLRVKELDGEIIEIEKAAELVANKKTEIKISLKVNDMEQKASEKNKVEIDEDGSLRLGSDHTVFVSSIFGFRMSGCSSDKPKKEYTLRQDHLISDTVAIQVLGVLLAEKLEARKLAIKSLNKIGIEL